MTVSLSLSNSQSYQINESRIDRMMSSDREKATEMGLWDRFKDLFRSDKKSEALNELYNLIHGNNSGSNTFSLGSVSTFEKLRSMAGEAHQDLFSYHESNGSIEFHIDGHHVHTEPYENIIRNSKFSDGTDVLSGYRQICHDFCKSNSEDFQSIHKNHKGKPVKLDGVIGADERAEYSEYFFNKSDDAKPLTDFFGKIGLGFDNVHRLMNCFNISEPRDSCVVDIFTAYIHHSTQNNGLN